MNIDVLDFKIQGEATYRLNDDIAIKTLLSTRQAYTSTTHKVHEASNIVQALSLSRTSIWCTIKTIRSSNPRSG